MDKEEKNDFREISTFELAFNLATGAYSEQEKLEVLKVIKERERKSKEPAVAQKQDEQLKEKKVKPPLKGSKSERILQLAELGKTPKETFEILEKEGAKTYFSEVYRIYRKYGKL